jgi:hypothetical protein
MKKEKSTPTIKIKGEDRKKRILRYGWQAFFYSLIYEK